MLKVICVLILLFVLPWSTWAADFQNPTRFRDEYGRMLAEILEAAAIVSVPALAPIPAKKRT